MLLTFVLIPSVATAIATVVNTHAATRQRNTLVVHSSGFPSCEFSVNEILHSPDDLTAHELSLRFVDVLAYFQNENPCRLSPTQVRENMLRTRHADLRLARCFVAESTIPGAGLGVFAGRDISKGEMITLYPGDALLKWENANDFEDRTAVNVLFGPHITAEELGNVSKGGTGFFCQGADKARLFEVRVSGLHSLIGDPGRRSDPAYLGHMLNDFAILTGRSALEKKVYNFSSLKGANSKIQLGEEGCHVVIVATRPIKSGEECLLSYGVMYWMSHLGFSNATARQPRNKRIPSTKKRKRK